MAGGVGAGERASVLSLLGGGVPAGAALAVGGGPGVLEGLGRACMDAGFAPTGTHASAMPVHPTGLASCWVGAGLVDFGSWLGGRRAVSGPTHFGSWLGGRCAATGPTDVGSWLGARREASGVLDLGSWLGGRAEPSGAAGFGSWLGGRAGPSGLTDFGSWLGGRAGASGAAGFGSWLEGRRAASGPTDFGSWLSGRRAASGPTDLGSWLGGKRAASGVVDLASWLGGRPGASAPADLGSWLGARHGAWFVQEPSSPAWVGTGLASLAELIKLPRRSSTRVMIDKGLGRSQGSSHHRPGSASPLSPHPAEPYPLACTGTHLAHPPK